MTPDHRVTLPQLLEQFPWLTERRVRSMVAERRIPHWKFAGRLLFDPADFQALVDAGYVPPAPAPGRGEVPPEATRGTSSQRQSGSAA